MLGDALFGLFHSRVTSWAERGLSALGQASCSWVQRAHTDPGEHRKATWAAGSSLEG